MFRARLAELPGVEVGTKVLGRNSPDPLEGAAAPPDLLIHQLGDTAERELEALASRPARLRPTTLILAPRGEVNARIMRLAMQAGARDFLVGPGAIEDALAATRKIVKEKRAEASGAARPLTAVLNAKDGAGASTVAGNLAQVLAAKQQLRTALLDLDLQFGAQSLNFDLHPQQGLLEALEALDSLDEIALGGYMARHGSGLHILGTLPGQLLLPGELPEQRFGELLNLIQRGYDHVVVDLPRRLDPLFHLIMERATRVLLVCQQNLANLRAGQKLVRILAEELGVPRERLLVVLNRHDPRHAIGIDQVKKTLQQDAIVTIPNDFKSLGAAADLGLPILDYAPRSPATRALRELAAALGRNAVPEKKGFFQQFITRFSQGA